MSLDTTTTTTTTTNTNDNNSNSSVIKENRERSPQGCNSKSVAHVVSSKTGSSENIDSPTMTPNSRANSDTKLSSIIKRGKLFHDAAVGKLNSSVLTDQPVLSSPSSPTHNNNNSGGGSSWLKIIKEISSGVLNLNKEETLTETTLNRLSTTSISSDRSSVDSIGKRGSLSSPLSSTKKMGHRLSTTADSNEDEFVEPTQEMIDALKDSKSFQTFVGGTSDPKMRYRKISQHLMITDEKSKDLDFLSFLRDAREVDKATTEEVDMVTFLKASRVTKDKDPIITGRTRPKVEKQEPLKKLKFNAVLENIIIQKAFMEYLKRIGKPVNQEQFMFLSRISELRAIDSSETSQLMSQKLRAIYDDFLRPGAKAFLKIPASDMESLLNIISKQIQRHNDTWILDVQPQEIFQPVINSILVELKFGAFAGFQNSSLCNLAMQKALRENKRAQIFELETPSSVKLDKQLTEMEMEQLKKLSFFAVLEHPPLTKAFCEYLKKENSEEQTAFLFALADLKTIDSSDTGREMATKANVIYEEFIKVGGKHELNLSPEMRALMKSQLDKQLGVNDRWVLHAQPRAIFAPLKNFFLLDLKSDAFMRFKQTKLCYDAVKQFLKTNKYVNILEEQLPSQQQQQAATTTTTVDGNESSNVIVPTLK